MHPAHFARIQPDKPAFIMAGSGVSVSYRELEERSNQVAHLLRKLGLKAGDHIAILLENHPRFYEICFGAHRAGIIYTAMSTRLTVSEAAYIVENCEARVLIASHAMRGLAQELLPHTAALKARLMLDGVPPDCAVGAAGYTAFEAAIAGCPITPISDETAGGDML